MRASAPAPYPRLLADIGGTGARLGWIESAGQPIVAVARYECATQRGVWEVLERYLVDQHHPRPRSAAIGVAATVTGKAVAMSNRSWRFSIDELERALGVDRLVVINDFAALAHGLRNAPAAELRPVGAGVPLPGAPFAVVGPGTGLGVAGWVGGASGAIAIVGEGGHASLTATDAREDSIVALLRKRFGHASAERALSGPGIVNLYDACCALAGSTPEPLDAAAIAARALAGTDGRCSETLAAFFAFLGSFAGNVALTLGARGGVFVGGGIVARLADVVDASMFRQRFEAKGRFRPYLAAIATQIVLDSPAAALRGANAVLDD